MSKSLLIIDDCMPIHKLIKAQLESEHLTIHSAYDGESGLAAVTILQPGLLLLDVDMPGIDGFEVYRRLKADPQTADIPVVFLSVISGLHNRLKAVDIGALDYVSKPFKPRELRARVNAVLHLRN